MPLCVCVGACVRACTRCLFTYPEHVSTSEITPTAVTQPDELSSNMRLSQLAFVKPPWISKKQMEDRKKMKALMFVVILIRLVCMFRLIFVYFCRLSGFHSTATHEHLYQFANMCAANT